MKAVLISLNSKYIHASLAPWYLLAAIRKQCGSRIEARVTEGTVNEPVEAVIARIRAEDCDVAGFSCYIWNIERVMEIGAYLHRKYKNMKIILGGPEVSYRAQSLLETCPWIYAVISGEGEVPLPALLEAMENGDDIEEIPGVCGRKDGRIFVHAPYIGTEIPPDPYTEEYFAALDGRIAYFESSRGCPFSCAFCLSGRCGSVRYFPAETCRETLIRLANAGTRTVKFVDRTFNAHPARTNAWLQFLKMEYGKRIPKQVRFHFEIAGDLLQEDTMELMGSLPAGMVQLEIGLQSFHEKTLAAVTRKTDVEKLERNIRKLLSFGNMHIHLDLIMGLPFEDMAGVRESFNRAFRLRPHMLQVGFLKLLYGAAMREEPDKFPCRFDPRPPYEVICTPWLSEEELKALHLLEDAVERIYNSGRFLRTMAYCLGVWGCEGFDFFMNIGQAMKAQVHPGLSLNAYGEMLFEVLSADARVDRQALRDHMVMDRLETDCSGRLPSYLRVEDPRLRQLRKALGKDGEKKAKPGVKRGLAILYSQNCGVYVDYDETKDAVRGRYLLHMVPFPG